MILLVGLLIGTCAFYSTLRYSETAVRGFKANGTNSYANAVLQNLLRSKGFMDAVSNRRPTCAVALSVRKLAMDFNSNSKAPMKSSQVVASLKREGHEHENDPVEFVDELFKALNLRDLGLQPFSGSQVGRGSPLSYVYTTDKDSLQTTLEDVLSDDFSSKVGIFPELLPGLMMIQHQEDSPSLSYPKQLGIRYSEFETDYRLIGTIESVATQFSKAHYVAEIVTDDGDWVRIDQEVSRKQKEPATQRVLMWFYEKI